MPTINYQVAAKKTYPLIINKTISQKSPYFERDKGFLFNLDLKIKSKNMSNNDVLKKLRVALQLRTEEMVEIIALAGFKTNKSELGDMFRSDDHPNFKKCGDQILRKFLDGLIIHLRGPKSSA